MTWAEGHPEHWCNELVSLGYNRPPELHRYEHGSCVYCGHTPSAPNPVEGVCVE